MDQRTTLGNLTSRPTWEGLPAGRRPDAQPGGPGSRGDRGSGRVRSPRRAALDAPFGDRNGDGTPRRLLTPMGTLTRRRPRVRGRAERVARRILPLFARRTKEVPARAGRGRRRPGPAGIAR